MKKNKITKTESLSRLAPISDGTQAFEIIKRPERINDEVLYWGIGRTTDYSLISDLHTDFPELNRVVNRSRAINKLLPAIIACGFVGGISVVIYNGKLYCVDGNHRLFVLMQQGLPIVFNYRFVDTFEELHNAIILLNNTSINWFGNQFTKSYKSTKNDTYIYLDAATKRFSITRTWCAALIGNLRHVDAKKAIKDGTLKTSNYKASLVQMQLIDQFVVSYKPKNGISRLLDALIPFAQQIGFTEFKRILPKLIFECNKERTSDQTAAGYYKMLNAAYNKVLG